MGLSLSMVISGVNVIPNDNERVRLTLVPPDDQTREEKEPAGLLDLAMNPQQMMEDLAAKMLPQMAAHGNSELVVKRQAFVDMQLAVGDRVDLTLEQSKTSRFDV